jgi:large subunit ribosomal protein L24
MTQKKLKIKKGDVVEVIAGKNKGQRGEVMKIDRDTDRVFVKGVNMVRRFVKQSAANPDGAYDREASLHISNVAVVDTTTNGVSRIGFKIQEDGSKVRFFKKSGAVVA